MSNPQMVGNDAGKDLQVKEMINITAAAKQKFVALLDDADETVLAVRVYVSGGGAAVCNTA